MVWNNRSASAVVLTFLLAVPNELILAQQAGLPTSFLAPAAVHSIPPASPAAAAVSDSEHLPYVRQIRRDRRLSSTVSPLSTFSPNASDLVIQQSEEKFAAGRKFYQERDFDRARVAYDTAIAMMLQGSEDPTDRRLFEARLEEMVDSIHHDDLSGFGSASQGNPSEFDKPPLDDILTMTFPVDPRLKDKVQTEVNQTSSALPLVVNDTVLSYINFFNTRGHRTLEAGLARAGKYRRMISRVLAEEGVPQELIHLAQAESGFIPRALSRAAAGGMWQFVKFRGNEYGLRQTAYSDERFDPEKATRAAARHLHDLYNEFGDWYLAIAAYNCGPGNVEKAVERTGYADFWELRARGALPAETTAYVPIILAMTIMAKNAAAYHLDQVVPDDALEYDTVVTTAQTNLALIADLTDTAETQLLQLNPALLKRMIPSEFEVRVPKGLGEMLQVALENIPGDTRASARMHRIEEGESLATLARKFKSTEAQLAALNMLSGDDLETGRMVVVPGAYKEPVVMARKGAVPLRAHAGAKSAPQVRKVQDTLKVAAKPAPPKTAGTVAQGRARPPALNR